MCNEERIDDSRCRYTPESDEINQRILIRVVKSIKEIETMLTSDLCVNADKVDCSDDGQLYYSILMGDVSFVLAGLLHQHLKAPRFDWCKKKWIDDCLLLKCARNKNGIDIFGSAIWGREGVNSQWVELFFFNAELDCDRKVLLDYVIMFGDASRAELKYEDFLQHRECWSADYYSDSDWDPYSKEWRYVIGLFGDQARK